MSVWCRVNVCSQCRQTGLSQSNLRWWIQCATQTSGGPEPQIAVTTIPRHILGMDKEIDKGLAAFATTLQGPFGQIPFERAVARHLPLFLGLRQRGVTWTRVASL